MPDSMKATLQKCQKIIGLSVLTVQDYSDMVHRTS